MNLKEARQDKGLTQQQLADKLGITRQTISHIECGRIKPSIDNAKAIANVLGFEWSNFFN